MIFARVILDCGPGLWEQIFSRPNVIGAAFVSTFITTVWLASILWGRRGGQPPKVSAGFKYFAIATIGLALFALPHAWALFSN